VIRRIRITLAVTIALMLNAARTSPAFAEGDTASTKFFSAKVVNIRRAATGKTLVTVLFTSNVSETSSVTLYSGTDECRKSATLIDGDGSEYGTLRCMTPAPQNDFDSDRISNGMYIEGGSSSSFVYEFSTPLPSDASIRAEINVVIPIAYRECHLGRGYILGAESENATLCRRSTSALSFYGLTARK
jgi:hypothetical protein